jgi:hypothetical protein
MIYCANIIVSGSQVKTVASVVSLLDLEAFHVHLQCLFQLFLIFVYMANIVVRNSQVKIIIAVVRPLNVETFEIHVQRLL